MPISAEQFEHPYLIQLSFCGAVDQAGDGDLLEWLEQSDSGIRLQARLSVADEADPVYVLLIVDKVELENEQRVHFHIDIAKRSFFQDNPPFEESDLCGLGELTDVASRFVGKRILAMVDSRFCLEFTHLSRHSFMAPILDIDAESESGIHLKMTGGRCDLGPLPLRRMSWYLRSGNPQRLNVNVNAASDFTFSDQIVREVVACILPPFEAFVIPATEESE